MTRTCTKCQGFSKSINIKQRNIYLDFTPRFITEPINNGVEVYFKEDGIDFSPDLCMNCLYELRKTIERFLENAED